jgi:hypothetical protein
VRLYRAWLLYDPAGRAVLEAARVELRGKCLACWCRVGEPCHADVLMEALRDGEGTEGTDGTEGGSDERYEKQ